VIAKLKCEMIQVFRTLAPHNDSETILFQRSSTNFFLFNNPCSPYELAGIKSARKSVILKIISRKTNVYNALMKLVRRVSKNSGMMQHPKYALQQRLINDRYTNDRC